MRPSDDDEYDFEQSNAPKYLDEHVQFQLTRSIRKVYRDEISVYGWAHSTTQAHALMLKQRLSIRVASG